MSKENAERVERLYEHLDKGEIDAGLAVVLEEFRQEPTEVVDVGEYVIVCVHQSARMRGAVIEQDEVHVSRLRDGYVIEFREFHEKGEALEAVGLEE